MGSLSEAKKGVAKVCGDRLSSVGDYSRQRTPGVFESPTDLQGLMLLPSESESKPFLALKSPINIILPSFE